jgi:hypothetical protein
LFDVVQASQEFVRSIIVEIEVGSHRDNNKLHNRFDRRAQVEPNVVGIKRLLVDCFERAAENVINVATLQDEIASRFTVLMCLNQSRTNF